ncbi:MAG: hypothetical protein JNK64_11570 [Myxococcales bacterium]|nr:hypothetical protein [Myxococcales bacterium]
MTNSIMRTAFVSLALVLAAACGKGESTDPKAMEARLVQIKDEVCACHTQRCAMDAKGKAEKIQLAYGKKVKGAEIPQAVLDNYLAMETCYREVNEGKR